MNKKYKLGKVKAIYVPIPLAAKFIELSRKLDEKENPIDTLDFILEFIDNISFDDD